MYARLIHILALVVLLLLALVARAEEGERLFSAIQARDAARVDAMLSENPGLLEARRGAKRVSPVSAALFVIDGGFIPPAENATLRAVMKHRPALDVFEASGVGDLARVRAVVEADPALAVAWSTTGWTPLHLASFGGHAEIARFLLRHGAATQVNARARTVFRNTPLQAALLTGQYATARLLIEEGADVLVRQAKGFTPMHEAAFLGRRDLIDLLLEHGAELNSVTDDGRTPLSEAMRGGREEMVRYLKAKGAEAGWARGPDS